MMLSVKQRRFIIVICITLLLLVPFTAMHFSNDVNWSLTDFVIAGTILIGVGFILEIILTYANNKVLKTILIFTLIIIFILTWMELAVGIFGSPFAGN